MLRLAISGTALAGLALLAGCAPVQGLQSVAAAGGALANSMTATGERTAALSAVELRQLQTRDYPATKPAAFASVVTVLLDSGYRVQSADRESGLITAAAPSTGRLRLDPAGVARATQTPVASAYVEERGSDTVRVRIAFSIGSSATGQLGSSGEKAVLDQGVYASFFARLEEEMQLRPAPAAAPAAPPHSSASSGGTVAAGSVASPAAEQPAVSEAEEAASEPAEAGQEAENTAEDAPDGEAPEEE